MESTNYTKKIQTYYYSWRGFYAYFKSLSENICAHMKDFGADVAEGKKKNETKNFHMVKWQLSCQWNEYESLEIGSPGNILLC